VTAYTAEIATLEEVPCVSSCHRTRSLCRILVSSVNNSFAQPVSGNIGLKVLIQPWNPATDDDTCYSAD
jgi:hypothetical protein